MKNFIRIILSFANDCAIRFIVFFYTEKVENYSNVVNCVMVSCIFLKMVPETKKRKYVQYK